MKREVIKIKREDVRFKPRMKLKASKPHRDKSKYTRKDKHKGTPNEK
jgi:hypothetical protein